MVRTGVGHVVGIPTTDATGHRFRSRHTAGSARQVPHYVSQRKNVKAANRFGMMPLSMAAESGNAAIGPRGIGSDSTVALLPRRSTAQDAPTTVLTDLPPACALALPLVFSITLAAFGLMPQARQDSRLLWSLLAAAAALVVWSAVLMVTAWARGRTFTLEIILRKQHYIQACAHTSIFLYWGWYWPQVYDWAPLIVAQLVFAYAFEMLLAWSRRETYALGFGPFPVIGSINLFLWFKPDWYYLQLLMVAVGFLAKELIRWNKDGRRVHIFNPSSFPLAVFSLCLILTNSTDITWGQEVATTLLDAPYIYFFIFLVALPGQFFFGVTTMTMSAVATMYMFSLLYYLAHGVYFFPDAFIPIAVFLGMHLLFTDPSTAPRTELARFVFGGLYALSVIALFSLLNHLRIPSFYDKLLGVPVLNLTIKWIDTLARSKVFRRFDPAAVGRTLTPRRRNLAYMSIWCLGFVGLSALHVNMPEADGTTALHWAVRRNHLFTVRLLLRSGANGNAANGYGVTPLSLAASSGNATIIRALVHGGADPNASIAEGLTMLMLAASTGHVDAVRTLLAAGAHVNTREPVLGETALIWAAKAGQPETIKVLLRNGADINARAGLAKFLTRPVSEGALPSGSTALVYAIRRNAQSAARALVDANADLDASAPDGATPLQLAIVQAEFDLAAFLLEKGADPNIADNSGVTPLYAVVDMNTLEEIPGALVPTASSLLHPADIVASLLAHRANPNAKLTAPALTRGYRTGDPNIGEGATPFLRAAWRGDTTVMRLLLEHGADPALVTKDHATALMFAAGFGGGGRSTIDDDGLVEAARLCLRAGQINAVNDAGQTALHIAAAERGERFVRFLVENGARLDTKDKQGRTPLDIASGAGHESTAAFLRQSLGKGVVKKAP